MYGVAPQAFMEEGKTGEASPFLPCLKKGRTDIAATMGASAWCADSNTHIRYTPVVMWQSWMADFKKHGGRGKLTGGCSAYIPLIQQYGMQPGVFDDATVAITKEYQMSKGIKPTGRVGEETWRALKADPLVVTSAGKNYYNPNDWTDDNHKKWLRNNTNAYEDCAWTAFDGLIGWKGLTVGAVGIGFAAWWFYFRKK